MPVGLIDAIIKDIRPITKPEKIAPETPVIMAHKITGI